MTVGKSYEISWTVGKPASEELEGRLWVTIHDENANHKSISPTGLTTVGTYTKTVTVDSSWGAWIYPPGDLPNSINFHIKEVNSGDGIWFNGTIDNISVKEIISDPITVSFKEDVRGWVSFKSFVTENALSVANDYYTTLNGKLYKHHIENNNRNNFYGVDYNSSVNVLLNDMPGSVKSFHTLGYEGSQSRVLNYSTVSVVNEFGNTVTLSDAEVYNLTAKDGWYVDSIKTSEQEGSLREFIEKEGKWFNYIKGINSRSTIGEEDFGLFSIQGIGSGSRGIYIADVATGVGGIVSIISFDNEINSSLQVGDTVYANDTLADEAFFQTMDTANAVYCGTVTHVGSSWEDFIPGYDSEVWLLIAPTTGDPFWAYDANNFSIITTANPYQMTSIVIVSQSMTNQPFQSDSYYFFTKNQVINTSSLIGYYADVKLINNSKKKIELFSLGAEVTESSK